MNARTASILLMLASLLVIAGSTGSASATHLGFKPCSDVTLRRASVKHVKSNFGCRGARRVLRSLLAHGIGGLPKPTKRVGHWGCTDTNFQHFYVCERPRSDGQAPTSVVFAARSRRATSGSAARARGHLVQCSGFTAKTVKVTRLRSNFGCVHARAVLRGLLKQGISSLPSKTRRKGRWGCKRSGADRVCTRYRSRPHRPRRVLFRAATVAKPPPPPPPVADIVQQCIDIWNADGANRATYGFHFYADHKIREAWVSTVPNSVNPAILRCAVIFVVPPDDPYTNEYGKDGEVRTSSGGGWELMDVIFGDSAVQIQQQAPQNVNASLQADGSLARKG